MKRIVISAAAAYKRGLTVSDVAEQLGLHEKTVRRYLAEAEVPLRRRGPRDLPVKTKRIVKLRNEGYSWNSIAKQLGMSERGVATRYRRDVLNEPQQRGKQVSA